MRKDLSGQSRPEAGDLVVPADVKTVMVQGIGWRTLQKNEPAMWLGQYIDSRVSSYKWVLLLSHGHVAFVGNRSGWRVVSKYREAI